VPEPEEPDDADLVCFDLGYEAGFGAGIATGQDNCRQDPSSCSIFLNNVLPPAQYGETEPNDTSISADPLSQHVNFWGQSYGYEDEDWYYLVTPEQNYNLTINFSLPEATGNDLSGWHVSVRNAIGMILAEFDTGFTTVEFAKSGISYRTTLGLSSTYYVVVRPTKGSFSYQPYNLAVALEPSPYQGPNFAGGFANAEVEPNNLPGQGTFIGRGVSMYGLINLRFDAAICDAEECTYAQDESDWYIYESPGNEILQLVFCERTRCSDGDWFVHVFDLPTADAIMNHGLDPNEAEPLMAFNTNICSLPDCEPSCTVGCTDPYDESTNPQRTWQTGLMQPGPYFIRVGHKRTLQAPCIQWATDKDNNGIPDGTPGNCGCTDGSTVCDVDMINPGAPDIGNVDQVFWPSCPDGSGGGESAYCDMNCVCIDGNCSLYQTDADGDGLPGPDPVPCRCLPMGTTVACTVSVQNPGQPIINSVPQFCPDGSGGSGEFQCTVNCICTETSGIVEIPENLVTSQYNFTLTTSAFGSPQ
jgi:hypothetical protein